MQGSLVPIGDPVDFEILIYSLGKNLNTSLYMLGLIKYYKTLYRK